MTKGQLQALDGFLAANAGADAPLVRAILVAGEMSTGDPAAISPKGARGLGQLTPIAVKDFGGDPETFPYDNPTQSVMGALRYVRILRDKYGLTNPLQLAAAYNAGPGAVQQAVKAGGIGGLPDETRAYVARVHTALGASPPLQTPLEAPGTVTEVPAVPLRPPSSLQAGAPPQAVSGVPPGAAPAMETAPARSLPVRLAQQAGSGLVSTTAGLVDLAAGSILNAARMGAQPPTMSGVSEAIAPHLAPPPAGVLERYARAGGEGALFGPIGVAAGLTGELAGDVVETAGGPRIVGEIGGALLAPGATMGGRLLTRTRGLKRAAIEEAAQTKVAVAAAREAAKAEILTAQQTGEAGLEVARRAGVAQTGSVAQAGAARVTQAEATAVHAADIAARQAVATEQEIGTMLAQQNPADRASMLAAVMRDHYGTSDRAISASYNVFHGAMDARGVRIPLPRITATADELVRLGQANGLAPDQAVAAANRIIAMAAGEEGATSWSVAQATAFRSELGGLLGRAKGATGHRVRQLYRSVDTAMREGLPRDAIPTWETLRASRTEQARLFQNKFVAKALDDSPEGLATAESYVARQVEKRWTPATAIEVRQVLNATGTNTMGHELLKDATMRQAVIRATNREGAVDYAAVERQLTSREGLAPIFEMVVRDPRERANVLGALRDATRERARAVLAQERIAIEQAAAQQGTRLAERVAHEGTAEAKRVLTRDIQALRIQTNQRVRAAVRAARTAKERLPARPTQLNAFDALLLLPTSGAYTAARRSLHWLRQGQNRAFVRQAARTMADSTTGRQLLQSIAAGGVPARVPRGLPSFAGGPQPVAAEPEQAAY